MSEPLPSSNSVSQSGAYSAGANVLPMVDGLEADLLLVDLKFIAKSGKKQKPAWTVKVEVMGTKMPEAITVGRKYDLYFNLDGAHDIGIKKWVTFLATCKGLAPNTPFDSDAYRDELYTAANSGKLAEKGVMVTVRRSVDNVSKAELVDGKPTLVTKQYPNDRFFTI